MAENRQQEIADRFRTDGLCYPVEVLSVSEAGAYRQRCDDLEAALGGRPRTIEVRQMHLHFPWAHELITRPAVLDAVEAVLGPDLVVWATELFAKHPQDANVAIGWHRDRVYIDFPPEDVATAWIALSDCNAANGCMRAIPGTDRFDIPEAEQRATNASERIPEESIDHDRAVNVELRAGEMSLHDPTILHGSGPNLSDHKRVGFAVRFVRATTRPRHGTPSVVSVRGDVPDDAGYEVVEPPTTDADVDALRASARQHLDAILVTLSRNRQ